MSAADDGGSAFPFAEATTDFSVSPGMTLRDWFAGQALTGMLDRTYGIKCEIIAARSYEMADAMLTARNNLP